MIHLGNFRLGSERDTSVIRNIWIGVGLRSVYGYNKRGIYDINNYGLYNMGGNATEFVSDGHSDIHYVTLGPSANTRYGYFSSSAGMKFVDGIKNVGRKRYYPIKHVSRNETGSFTQYHIGFRCVKDLE